jgi:neutral ceramidase
VSSPKKGCHNRWRFMKRRAFLTTAAATLASPMLSARRSGPTADAGWRAGVAVVDITPRRSIWMAGFAARTRPSQGVALPLHAKALALEDAAGSRAVIVSLDLLGVTADVTARVAERVAARTGLSRERLLLAASHTHCGPVTTGLLSVAYDLDQAQKAEIHRYTETLEPQIVEVIVSACNALAPATLHGGASTASFAANRRTQYSPNGPVDHDVPILRVDVAGSPRAIVFGYACHNTTLPATEVEFHGDYAGVAQAAIETRHRGVTAFFVTGCGADANPRPRGARALVNQHGEALAAAVTEGLAGGEPIAGPLVCAAETVELPFAPPPDRAEWEIRAVAGDAYVRRHAALMLDAIARHGRLPASQPDPIAVWRLGRQLTLVALGGEVVVDYALRLKREYPRQRLWPIAYANDVFGYVPSRRVLEEGGYEGGGAMLYYGRPGPFDTSVEERIMASVARLMRSTS